MTLAEWIDTHRTITAGPDAGTGKNMRSDLTPFLLEILDFALNPTHREGVVLKAARIGYTEGVIGTALLWTESLRPSPFAVLHPSAKEAQDYSRQNIQPMMEHVPCFRHTGAAAHATRSGRRQSHDTLLWKLLPNGTQFQLLGSVSGAQLRRREIKLAFADEIDGMRVDATEGDPLTRYRKRTMMYEDGVMLCGSTPTVKGESIIERRWEQSDKRRWFMPCPHCDHWQPATWKHIQWAKQIGCNKCGTVLEDGNECECGAVDPRTIHLPETAYFQCQACEGRIDEGDQKRAMVRAGEWRPTNPFGMFPGWHIPTMLSLFPTARWEHLVREWLDAQDDIEVLKVFVNQVMGETWEDPTTRPKVTGLEDRAELYVDARGMPVMVPDGVGLLTAGVDVQKDWLELLVRGWGIDDESWDIVHQRFMGLPQHPRVWAELDSWLMRPYRHASGAPMRIAATFIDSGGEWTGHVYSFTRSRHARGVFATKGDSGKRGAPVVKRAGMNWRPGKRVTLAQKANVPLYTLGTFTLKDLVYRRLQLEDAGAGYVHLRAADPDICNGFDSAYFKQFESEAKQLVRTKNGRDEYAWVKLRKRNEALDLQVMAAAAYEALAPRQQMPQLVRLASTGKIPTTGQREALVLHEGRRPWDTA